MHYLSWVGWVLLGDYFVPRSVFWGFSQSMLSRKAGIPLIKHLPFNDSYLQETFVFLQQLPHSPVLYFFPTCLHQQGSIYSVLQQLVCKWTSPDAPASVSNTDSSLVKSCHMTQLKVKVMDKEMTPGWKSSKVTLQMGWRLRGQVFVGSKLSNTGVVLAKNYFYPTYM